MQGTNGENVVSDIERLYNALRGDKINTAKMIHTHIKKFHNLDNKGIRESISTLGKKKIVEVTEQATRKSFR